MRCRGASPRLCVGAEQRPTYTGPIGDGTVVAQVVSNSADQAGIMVRDGFDPLGNYVYLYEDGATTYLGLSRLCLALKLFLLRYSSLVTARSQRQYLHSVGIVRFD